MKIICSQCKRHIGTIKIGFWEYEKKNGTREMKFIEDPNGTDVKYIQERGILSCRKRFDGHWGFSCGICGNDSRIAEAEKGIIGTKKVDSRGRITVRIPTKRDIARVFRNLEKRPTGVKEASPEKRVVDNFEITTEKGEEKYVLQCN